MNIIIKHKIIGKKLQNTWNKTTNNRKLVVTGYQNDRASENPLFGISFCALPVV